MIFQKNEEKFDSYPAMYDMYVKYRFSSSCRITPGVTLASGSVVKSNFMIWPCGAYDYDTWKAMFAGLNPVIDYQSLSSVMLNQFVSNLAIPSQLTTDLAFRVESDLHIEFRDDEPCKFFDCGPGTCEINEQTSNGECITPCTTLICFEHEMCRQTHYIEEAECIGPEVPINPGIVSVVKDSPFALMLGILIAAVIILYSMHFFKDYSIDVLLKMWKDIWKEKQAEKKLHKEMQIENPEVNATPHETEDPEARDLEVSDEAHHGSHKEEKPLDEVKRKNVLTIEEEAKEDGKHNRAKPVRQANFDETPDPTENAHKPKSQESAGIKED